MGYPSEGLGGKRIAAIVVLLIIAGGLGAGASYYLAAPRAAAAVTNTTTTTSTLTTTVNGGNLSASVGASTTPSINAVQIYKDSNESVVTVEGFTTASVSSFFGSESVEEEILGSGFAYSYDNANYIVTNFHVVNGVDQHDGDILERRRLPGFGRGDRPVQRPRRGQGANCAVLRVPAAHASPRPPPSRSETLWPR